MLMIEVPHVGGFTSFDDARKDPRATLDAQAALNTFESLLGRGWPRRRTDRQLATRFFVTFQRCEVFEGVRLARLIEEIRPHVEPRLLRSLVRRLLGSTEYCQYVAGDTALSFMACLIRAGRPVRPIPEINEPTADVEVVLDVRPLTVEFKAMHASADDRLAWDFIQAIADAGVDLNSIVGDIPTIPPREAHATIAAAVATGLIRDESSEKIPILGGWIQRQNEGATGLRIGPAGKTDRERILDRIENREYVKQLAPAQGPTVVLVRSQTAFLGASASLIRCWIADIAERLSRAPALGAVIVVEDGGGQLGYHSEGAFRFLVDKDPQDRVPRTVLLVANKHAYLPLTPAELDALAGPSMVW